MNQRKSEILGALAGMNMNVGLEVNSPSSWTSLGAREAFKVDLSPWVHPWISKGGKVHGAIQTVRRRPGNVNLLFFSFGGLSPGLPFVVPLPFYCASLLFFFLSVFSLPLCWAYSCCPRLKLVFPRNPQTIRTYYLPTVSKMIFARTWHSPGKDIWPKETSPGKSYLLVNKKITENHHCGTMVFARQKIFQKKKMIMPETEGDFALSLEYFSLKTTFLQMAIFHPTYFLK